MPALTLDIKTPNTLEKMALKTAKALDQVAQREAKLNALMAKGMKTGKVSGELQKKTAQALVRLKKQIVEQSAKDIAMGTKRDSDGKKQLSFTEKLSKNYLMVRDAVMIAWRAAKAMTLDAMEKGNEIEKLTAAMKFEVDLFASGTDQGKQFQEIEKFAKGNVKLTKEMTDEWLKFRKASSATNVVTNEIAASMLRVWADVRAISQSSEVASKFTDEWVEKFKESPYAAARFLAFAKGAHKEWKGIGDGAAFKNMKGPLAIEDKMEAASNKMTSALAPLTKLLNDLRSGFADFMTKLASNKMFKNFITEVAKDIRWFITEGLPAFGVAISKFFTTLGEESEKFVQTSGEAMDKVGGFMKKIFDFVNPAQIFRDIQNGPPPSPAPPPPRQTNDPTKHGSYTPKAERQLAGITIQNMNITGAEDAEQIGRSVRQELQLLLQAGALSKGYA